MNEGIMCPKDQWLIDCIDNFLCDDDLKHKGIKLIQSITNEGERLAHIDRMSINQKNSIIRMHEDNLKNRTA